MDYEELSACVLDLQRQVQDLERVHYGAAKTSLSPHNLESLYVVATALEPPTQANTVLWVQAILSLSTANLITLAHRVGDPFCWKTFFFLLQTHAAAGFDTLEAFVHLWSRANEMLAATGLGLLRPDDVMGTQTQGQKFKDYIIALHSKIKI